MDEQFDQELRTSVLAGPRLTLRPWRLDDAPVVHAAMQDESMHRFLPVPNPYTEQDAVSFVNGAAPHHPGVAAMDRALIDTSTGRLVGSASLRLWPPAGHQRTAEIGYAVYAGARGNNYAREAVEVLTAWAIGNGVVRVEIRCDVQNLASAKTALAAGFRFEAIVRRGIVPSDLATVDGALFARVGTDPIGPVERAFAALPDGGLTDGIVLLRELNAADAGAHYEEQADELTVTNGFTGVPPGRADVVAAAERGGLDWLVGGAVPFAIVDVESGRYAGSVRLRRAGPPSVGGIGYSVHPDFRGRGLTSRALRLLVAWAFESGFARLELGAKADNVASQRAALSAGFEPDGVRGARLRYPDGSYADEVRFMLINPSVRRRS